MVLLTNFCVKQPFITWRDTEKSKSQHGASHYQTEEHPKYHISTWNDDQIIFMPKKTHNQHVETFFSSKPQAADQLIQEKYS